MGYLYLFALYPFLRKQGRIVVQITFKSLAQHLQPSSLYSAHQRNAVQSTAVDMQARATRDCRAWRIHWRQTQTGQQQHQQHWDADCCIHRYHQQQQWSGKCPSDWPPRGSSRCRDGASIHCHPTSDTEHRSLEVHPRRQQPDTPASVHSQYTSTSTWLPTNLLLYDTHPLNGPLSRTTRVSRYQKGKTNLDFTQARDSEWQWHQLGHIKVSSSRHNHASTPTLSFLQATLRHQRNSYIILLAHSMSPRQQFLTATDVVHSVCLSVCWAYF